MRTLVSSRSEWTLGDLFRAAELEGRAAGKRPRTLEKYRLACESLQSFLGDLPLSQIRPGDLRRWVLHLLERYSPTTASILVRSARACFNWAYQEGLLPENPFARIKPPKVPKSWPKVLSPEELAELLRAAKRGSAFFAARNYCMLLTFIDGMLRLGELCRLELRDLSLESRLIRVREGKMGKDRVVPMGRRLARAMRDWLRARGYIPGVEAVFTTRKGDPMEPRNVQRVLYRLGAKAGVKVSPHMLRHSGATLFIRNGGNVFALQRILGHATVTVTQIYVHLSGAALLEAHRRASPGDSLEI